VPEHHFSRFGILPSPAIFLTHVAARTRTLRLGPATVVLPLNHPLRMVERFAKEVMPYFAKKGESVAV
jgi:alkanesulfonate monooxygenase SsuD/methylene tetrahydromethanopterin reductase-like flavin-dependent oxidoreductase (luciferase family)